MSSRKERREILQQKAVVPPVPPSIPSSTSVWQKITAVLAALTFVFLIWFDRLPVIRRWISPPEVRLGAAFYVYERGFALDGKNAQTFSELRNLPTNCYFWQAPTRPLSKTTKVYGLHATVLSKLRLENMSDERISNLRLSIAAPLFNKATVTSATPNVQAKGRFESTHNDALHTYVVDIDAIPPKDSAILSLETPIDDALRHFLYDRNVTFTIPIVSFSADQLKKAQPALDRINAKTMYKMEVEMRTGEKNISLAENFEIIVLSPSDPEPKDESLKLLPPASKCQEGTAGKW